MVGERTFMEYGKDNHPNIISASITTGWSSLAEWHLGSVQGKVKDYQFLSGHRKSVFELFMY